MRRYSRRTYRPRTRYATSYATPLRIPATAAGLPVQMPPDAAPYSAGYNDWLIFDPNPMQVPATGVPENLNLLDSTKAMPEEEGDDDMQM